MIKLEMKNFNIMLTDKQQKKLALPSEKADKYEYLTSEEILASIQRQVKVFYTQIKTKSLFCFQKII